MASQPSAWGNDTKNQNESTCSNPPVNKSQIIIYDIVLSLYWLMIIMGLKGLWQIPIAICNIAIFNLRKRLSLAGILIGQVVRSPRTKSIFGTRGLIMLQILNVLLTTCTVVMHYLKDFDWIKYIGLSFGLLAITYLILLAARRAEAGGIRMAIYLIAIFTFAFAAMMISEYYQDSRMFCIAVMIVINDWYYLKKLMKAIKNCCLSLDLTFPPVISE